MEKPEYITLITIPRYTCQRCAHIWIALNELKSPGKEPVACPKCNSPYYRTKSTRPRKNILKDSKESIDQQTAKTPST